MRCRAFTSTVTLGSRVSAASRGHFTTSLIDMSSFKQCFLNSVENLHSPIKLPNNQELVLGRGPMTKVNDKRCSRNQVTANCNYSTEEVLIRQTGDNISGINGLAIRKSEAHTLKHGDRLELLLGQHIYQVEFKPPTSLNDNPVVSSPSKRPNVSPTSGPNSKRIEALSSIKTSPALGMGFFSKNLNTEGKWETIDNGNLLIFTPSGLEGREKIASYDLDHTVITTKAGTVFPKDIDDWKIAFTEVPGKLKQLWSDGYKIVFFTNQGAIKKGKLNPTDFKGKVTKIISKLGVPIQAFVSTGAGLYRKPAPGMWKALTENMNCDVTIDTQSSFYCGDAAGRENNWAPKKKKDFSCSDRLFAINVGLQFLTPEEHFLNQRPTKFIMPEFNPSSFSTNSPACEPSDAVLALSTQEVIILVGYPGSGKSFFAQKHLVPAGYHHVNRDTMGSWQRCVGAMETALKGGKSVVVDNTNPDRDSRRKFLDVAKKLKVDARCFVMVASKEHSKHNNKFRELTDDKHEKVSEMVINMYRTKFEEPSKDEGFNEVVKIIFVPYFKDAELERLYKMYLV